MSAKNMHKNCMYSVYLRASAIQGINIAEREITLSQLADDTTLFIHNSTQVSLAINILRLFSLASGLHLNIHKCELFSIKNCCLTNIDGIPVKDKVTYLGIVISKDMKNKCVDNFSQIMEKTKKKLNLWLHRFVSQG